MNLYNAILQQQPNHPIAKKGLRKLQKELHQNPSLEADTSNPPQDQITSLVNLFHAEQIVELEEVSRKLLQQYPQSSIVMNILGTALGEQGQLKESIQVFDKAIQLKPDSAEAYNNRGIALQRLGQLDEAMQDFDKAIKLKPDYTEAYSNRGNALKDLRQLDKALENYDKAIQLKPDFTEAYNNRGNTLKDLVLLDEALKSYDKAIQLKPDFAEAYFNRGVILEQLGQLDEAIESHDKAIQHKPDYAKAYCNRGNALKALGQLDEALESYDKAIQLKPDYTKPYNNRGNILYLLGQLDEALKSFDKTIQLKPDSAEAYSNRGVALKDLGRLDEALTSFDKAIQLKPDYAEAYSNLLLTLNYTPDLNVSDHIATARKFGELVTEKAKTHFPDYQCLPTPEKLRVGLVSGDLCNHPIGYFLESVLSAIDPSKIELIAYPTTPIVDDLSERIKSSFSMWKPIYGQTDEAAANMIYADGVHVLLDLSGHTAGNRLLMFGHKPSPVQASWLGYFATTGLNEMDYLIGDPYVTPPKDDDQFTEKVWRLPETRWCFTPPDVDIEVSVPPAVKHGYVTFGCFNNTTKVNDRVVALWTKVLEAVPNSRLLLKAKQFHDQMARESIIQRFAAHGIDGKRISLEESENRQKYFAAYNKIDITLDPFPFTGGTTSVESLWMGVPLVTLAGGSLISRQGVGVLMNAGLSDWVAADEEEYVAKAVLFASDLDKLASLRAGLRSQVLASPLFDAPRFARNIEKALWEMWNQWDPPSTPKEMRKLPKESTQNKSVEAETSNPPQDQITALVNLFNAGQMTETEQACRELLQSYSQSLVVLHVLGVVLSDQGKLQEALENFDKAIQLKPDYAEAYSNRGIVLEQLGQLNEALKSFDKAIQFKPDYAWAYNNRGNALKALGQLDEALESYDKAIQLKPDSAEAHSNRGVALKDLGRLDQALTSFDKAIQLKPDYADAYYNRGITLKDLGRLNEAVASYDKAIQLKPDFVEAYSNRGITLNELGRLDEAVASCDKAIQLKPDFADAYSNCGIVLEQLGQLDEAVESYDKAIQLKPDFADAYSNRGTTLKSLGRLNEAVASYDKAIQLKPDFADAFSNRGITLRSLGRLNEAVASCDKAIQLKPDFADAYYNRGIALQELGRFQLAITSYQKAVSINPHNGLFWAGYASSLREVKFGSYNDELDHCLLQVLEQPTVRPIDVSVAVISALHYHPTVSRTLELSKSDRIDKNNIDHITEQLSTVPLLLRMMELSLIADLDVEKMLTKMRKAMLHKAASGGGEAQGLPFYSALAMHCFTNEYVFSENEEEKQELEFFQKEVKAILTKEGTVPPAWIAVLGAYRPLYSFSWANALLKTEWSNEIKNVIVGQVDNVRQEQILGSKIPRLTSIDDKVSQVVRNQYEENPYPRWINTGLRDKPKTTRQLLQLVNPHLNFDVQQFSNNPDILIAGCGTGQHALGTASRFRNCNVLAIDLSLSSLSYAKRKTKELGVTNIEYMQGDILKLDQLEREFNIVECVGVLHHMDNPLAGWEVLVGKLRVGGVMKIGLYSEIARRHVVACRREIAENGYTSSPGDIRRYREEVIKLGPDSDSEVIQVLGSSDFYSLSACRDLLFHVQEHRFTLLQIEEALNDLGLKFLGFEIKESSTRRRFNELYSDKDALISFPLWHQFELKNPDTFTGMYQFWVQKA